MKHMFLLLLSLISTLALAQAPEKHARVMELEDKFSSEASLYFERRYPGQPFLVKVDIVPLRREAKETQKSQDLPYFESESEEFVDEWDNLDLPLSYLRNRITKVTLDVSVPENFDDQKLAEIKQELPIYLRLLPYRDEIRVERKLKVEGESTPVSVFWISGGVLLAALLLGGFIRWSAGKIKTSEGTKAAAPVPMAAPSSALGSNSHPLVKGGSTSVSGDVTFHDPIKTIEIVHLKINQIKESGTFPTLSDMMTMDDVCQESPERLAAVIAEFPQEWQKTVYAFSKDDQWLEAFSAHSRIDQKSLSMIERLGRERSFAGPDRVTEDLLIMIWRMGDKASAFFKKIDQEHAFMLLGYLPKSLSIKLAKKSYPGAWARLLSERSSNVRLENSLAKSYLEMATSFCPAYTPKLLQDYKNGKEILSYLSDVSIDDEREIYETIESDSFIHNIRAPFFRTFELDKEKFKTVVDSFALDIWALVVINSHRNYIRQIMDSLDDKKKIVFSAMLKKYDLQKYSHADQEAWKSKIAVFVKELTTVQPEVKVTAEGEGIEDQRIA